MSLYEDIKNMFKRGKSAPISPPETVYNNLVDTLGRMPISLSTPTISSIGLKSKEQELGNRLEMYEDAFVRGILDVKVGMALGATDSTSKPYTIKISDDVDVVEEYREELNKELKHIRDITLDHIKTLAKDAEAITKGFCKIETELGVGVLSLQHNYITSARYINEIKNNKDETVAFEVAIESKGKKVQEVHSRKFVSPDRVCCLNAESNGYMGIQSDNLLELEKMNPFNDEETYYEDFLYGGSFEGVYEHYKKYKWALEALFNARVASSVIERFIIHNLDGLGQDEVVALKESLMKQIKNAGEKLKEKVSSLDPSASTLNTYIPTFGDINSVRIEDSDKNYNLSIEDILIHVKTFIGAVGYNFALTSYGGNERGGLEEGGNESNSIIMDAQSDRIRDGVTKFLKTLCKIHIEYKYRLRENSIEFNSTMIEVSYISVTNKSQLVAETQRLQAINNDQMLGSILEQFKLLKMNDNEGTRKYLKAMLKALIPQNNDDADEMVSSHIEYILEKPIKEEEV
ncbi:MAG TPA: hypothetical protein EYG70_04225 [Sulfurimonas sp.]|nr:hypothetical protein [Sulfurimonas sp.]